jgi:hypothetical protein
MRKKEGFLLDKLKLENSTNNKSVNILDEIKEFIPQINESSILMSKIKEIKSLQRENTLNSSNKVFEILKENIQHTYPFYFVFNNKDLPIAKILTQNKSLFEHIKTESLYNSLKSKFDSTINMLKEKEEIFAKINSKSSYALSTLLHFGGLAVLIIIINMFGSTGGALQLGTFILLCSLPVAYVILLIVNYSIVGELKSKFKQLNEAIQKNIILLKIKE